MLFASLIISIFAIQTHSPDMVTLDELSDELKNFAKKSDYTLTDEDLQSVFMAIGVPPYDKFD